ncbi:MAG: oxaloacetate decarboxylase [Beijerinckiaceae bacterium]
MTDAFIAPARRKRLAFRALLERPGLTVMPGGFSPIYARAAQMAGFECFFAAGSQMSAYLLGVPDTGIIGLRDMADHARHMAARSDVPILLDGDTGFGNAVNVYYTVQEIANAGVAAMSFEDQEAPKKSGTSAGRRCISAEEMVGKLQAACAARDEIDPAFSIVARCDLLGAEGGSFEAAYERCMAYATDGGADVVWLNSAQTLGQLEKLCADCPKPVLMIWGGAPPGPDFDALEKTGLKIALYPVLAASAGLQASWHVLNDFRTRGVQALKDWRAQVEASPYGAMNFAQITGAAKVRELEEKYMPADAQRDYESTWGHGTHLGQGDVKKD